MNTQRVVVTGATGSIGQHLVPLFLERGDEVHVVSRSPEKAARLGGEGKVTVHQTDFWDAAAVRELYSTVRPDEVYHLAASLTNWGKSEGLETLARVNILGTATMMEGLEVIPEVRFVYPGSFAEIGGKNEPIREDHVPEPQEFYGISKLTGTLEAKQLAKNKGYNIVVGRIFTAYGPGIPKERLVGAVLQKMQRNEPVAYSAPDVSRDFVYVTDIARALLELGERAGEFRGEVFNIGSGAKTTLKELDALAREIAGSTSKAVWQPEKMGAFDKLPWQADMTKTFGALRWRPEVSLRDGLQKTREWLMTE